MGRPGHRGSRIPFPADLFHETPPGRMERMTMPRPTQEDIRVMHARGDSDRSIAARLGISRNTVARYVRMTDMSPVTPMLRNAPHPATDAWARLVMAWLRDDLAVPRKQRRTARKIYDDLVHDHGYVGSRSSVNSP